MFDLSCSRSEPKTGSSTLPSPTLTDPLREFRSVSHRNTCPQCVQQSPGASPCSSSPPSPSSSSYWRSTVGSASDALRAATVRPIPLPLPLPPPPHPPTQTRWLGQCRCAGGCPGHSSLCAGRGQPTRSDQAGDVFGRGGEWKVRTTVRITTSLRASAPALFHPFLFYREDFFFLGGLEIVGRSN